MGSETKGEKNRMLLCNSLNDSFIIGSQNGTFTQQDRMSCIFVVILHVKYIHECMKMYG